MVLDIAENALAGGIPETIGNMATACEYKCELSSVLSLYQELTCHVYHSGNVPERLRV